MNLRATGKHVLIRPDEPPEQTVGGIVLPTAWQQPMNQGTVVSVGETAEDYDGSLIAGAKVVFSWIDRREVKVEGQEYWLFDFRQILGILTP